jgi:AcrR family transcriptional regulator
MVQAKVQARIVEAMMTLAAERRFEDVSLEAIAERAGVTLATLRSAYDTRLDILAAFVRGIDERVLGGIDRELAGEAPRERLFDVMFSRLEALGPYRKAIANIGRAARRDPALALALGGIATASMGWMLTAAGIPATGGRGLLRAQGLACVYARVMRVWIDDDDPGLAKTMAALDKRLREAERAMLRFERLCRILPSRHRDRPRPVPPVSDVEIAEGHPS